MLNRPYVIMQNGRPVFDYLVEIIDLSVLETDPMEGDARTVERLYDTLRSLQQEGEPVGNYVADVKEWLDEYALINAPEAPDDEEDG